MTTLTETAYYTRKAINWGLIALVLLFIFKIFLDLTLTAWKKIHPPAPPPPTVSFGKLPALKFPAVESDPSSPKLNFKLETIDGKTPIASSTGTVFFMPKPSPNLLSLNRTQQFAQKMGFTAEPQAENQNLYRWQDNEIPQRILRVDIVNGNFKLSYDYGSDLSVFTEKNLPNQTKAMNETTNYLQNLGLFSTPLEKGENKVSYYQLMDNNLLPTTSLANADAVRIDLGREDLLGLKLLSVKYPQELINLIFSGSKQTKKRFLELNYIFWKIEEEQSATYPLKTSAQAWEELRNGGGFIVRPPDDKQNVIVRKIYLAYFYPEEYQNFLQPIFVFEGDGNFLAFIPAVSPSWTAQ
ncbi:MAG: hypothetical protein M1575_02205 [Patescibacteria group bacterium]|nr:hypothetical protein [Patescibacteria group bacterium]